MTKPGMRNREWWVPAMQPVARLGGAMSRRMRFSRSLAALAVAALTTTGLASADPIDDYFNITNVECFEPSIDAATPPAGIGVTLSLPKTTFSGDEMIPLSLTVANDSDTTVHNTRASTQEFEFWIQNAEGQTVWFWSRPYPFGASIEEDEFAPGSSVTRTVEWDQDECGNLLYFWPGGPSSLCPSFMCPSGTYTARASWKTVDEVSPPFRRDWISNAVQFTIKPRVL